MQYRVQYKPLFDDPAFWIGHELLEPMMRPSEKNWPIQGVGSKKTVPSRQY